MLETAATGNDRWEIRNIFFFGAAMVFPKKMLNFAAHYLAWDGQNKIGNERKWQKNRVRHGRGSAQT